VPVSLPDPERHHLDSGDYHVVIDKVLARAGYTGLIAERNRRRAQACSPASASRRASSRAAPIQPSSRCSIRKTRPRAIPSLAASTRMSAAPSPPLFIRFRPDRGTRPLSPPSSVRCWEIDPERIRVVCPDSLSVLSSQSPVGSRMAIMLGGAAFHAAQKLKRGFSAIAAHDLAIPLERTTYGAGDVFDRAAPQNRRCWSELVTIAHRNFHRLLSGIEPGARLQPCDAGADRRQLPTAGGRVQMYPCFGLRGVSSPARRDRPRSRKNRRSNATSSVNDCGTVINPKIVRGMTMGGIAYGSAGCPHLDPFRAAADETGAVIHIPPEL
jgi:2-furoyl-CoA dehydrogenase large subunit